MKKLCLILAMALLLGSLPAFAAEGDAILGRDDENIPYFSFAFSDGDTLYLPQNGLEMSTWKPGDAELTSYIFDHAEDPEDSEDSDSYRDIQVVPFICDGQLYAITLTSTYDEHTRFEGAVLNRASLEGDGTVRLEALRSVEWEDLLEYYDEDTYVMQPSAVVAMEGKAYLAHYDSQYDNVVSVLDLETGKMEQVDELDDAYAIIPYKQGMLLAELYSYTHGSEASLVAYDAADGSAQTLTELQIDDYSPLTGLAYDEATDTLYCAKGGEIRPVDMDSGEVGDGVTDMPIETYGNASSLVMNGSYYVFAGEGVVVRNLDPDQRPEVRLKVVDSSYSEAVTKASSKFSNAHGEVGLVISRDYNDAQKLIENMMNRDDSVDIYTLYTESAIYDALFNRGYMMELDGIEAIDALAEEMYPSLRECLSVNGHLVALPLEVYSYSFGVNEKALEALGLTMDDVPDNWWDFLDFLPTLEDALAGGKVLLSYDETESDMRNTLFFAIFEDYQNYVNAVDPNMGYDTELLRGLLKKLEDIDFVALGCAEDPEEDEDPSAMMRSMEIDENTLMLFETSINSTIGTRYSDCTPIQMGLDADTRAPLVMHTSVAFINPFTRQSELAREFMAELAGNLPNTTLYNISPALNEPIRGAQYEQILQEAQESLDGYRKELENAEPAEKQMLEEQVDMMEKNVDYWQRQGWEISEESIGWFRAHAEGGLITAPMNWLYSDDSGEAWEPISQYRDGSISADEMLRTIDRKVQMMMMEGH